MDKKPLTLSIISHCDAGLTERLLQDIASTNINPMEVLLTLNVPEKLTFKPDTFPFPVRVIENERPRGFGANHNAAFRLCATPYFCVLNPDLRFPEDPFSFLLDECAEARVGVAAPLIVDPNGQRGDNARRFPTFWSLARKACTKGIRLDYEIADRSISPDWIAGMFMLMRSDVYRAVNGFDERYFLYYEDVDLCRRIRRCGLDIRMVPSVRVIHTAKRRSHRNLRYLRWHARSMLRFLMDD